MQPINQKIYGQERMSAVLNDIVKWNLEKKHGLSGSRTNRYAFIELNLYEIGRYNTEFNSDVKNYQSYIDWKVDEKLFPKSLYNIYIKELETYADFITNHISAIKGLRIQFVFEIIFAGFHVVDTGSPHAFGRAFINAIISCFDNEMYQRGQLEKQTRHSIEEINYRMASLK